MKADIYSETLALLDESEQTIDQIAQGAGVNRHWLAKLKQRKFDNPGVVTIQRLYVFLESSAPA